MASQPNNCSKFNFLDFNQTLLDTNDFHHEYDSLTFRPGNGPLNTPDLQIINPFAPSNSGPHSDAGNGDMLKSEFEELFSMDFDKEPSVPPEATNEEIYDVVSDIEAINNDINRNADQQVAGNAEQRIEAIEKDLRNAANEVSDKTELQAILNAMKQHHRRPQMTMRDQPAARQRIRYYTDRQRYLKGSKKTPMSINLPRLDGCLTKPYQSFWLLMTLVTTRENPQRKMLYHQHQMTYTGETAEKIGSRSFRIPITEQEIHRRVKKFRFLSLIKTKLEDYDFQLIPFDPLIPDDHVMNYTLDDEDEDQLTIKQKAKRFDTDYHTDDFQIFAQLLIKQNNQWHTTDLYCQTHVITDS